MTIRSYEQQLPLEGQVQTVWPERSAEERLDEIGVPTLVLLGDEDVEDIAQMAETLVAGIPGARLETIEGAGHLPSLERPDELNALLLDFLDDGV
jgi:pimeloyl-ACP methyl ester carboxylesterase